MSTPMPSPHQEIKVEGSCCGANKNYGGFWFRLLAYIIDTIIVNTGVILLVVLLAFPPLFSVNVIDAFIPFISGLAIWLYFTLMESSPWQATLGKKICGLKVANAEDFQRISFGRANGRFWSKILSSLILCIGYLMIVWTKRKQGLHDKIAHTVVLRCK